MGVEFDEGRKEWNIPEKTLFVLLAEMQSSIDDLGRLIEKRFPGALDDIDLHSVKPPAAGVKVAA
jgi:hypothetical protein